MVSPQSPAAQRSPCPGTGSRYLRTDKIMWSRNRSKGWPWGSPQQSRRDAFYRWASGRYSYPRRCESGRTNRTRCLEDVGTGESCDQMRTGVRNVRWSFVTVVDSTPQEVFIQQLVDGQLFNQVKTAEGLQHFVQMGGGGATIRQQQRHLHR